MSSARNSNEGGLPSLLISMADGVIDLGWGHPSEELHPLADVRRAAEFVLGGESVAALQYGAVQGFGPLLESLSGFLSNQPAYGMDVLPEQLFLTSGASQGLDMACTLFTQAGDTVYVEEPTYHLAHGIFRDHRLNVEGVATDAQGMRMDVLEDKLTKTESPNPAALYIIPTYQNPTGRVLPEERRRRLVQLADEHGFVVFADEVYQLLHAGAPPPPPLVAFDRTPRGRVVSIGSFSKILSPGLRAGWVQANAALTARFTNSGFAISGGGISHFSSTIAHATIALGLLEENVARLRATYAARIRAVDAALRERLADRCGYATPTGGYFYWLDLGEGVDTEALLPHAHEAGVSYLPGSLFSVDGARSSWLRMSFALYDVDGLQEGVRRLAQALDAYTADRDAGADREDRHRQ